MAISSPAMIKNKSAAAHRSSPDALSEDSDTMTYRILATQVQGQPVLFVLVMKSRNTLRNGLRHVTYLKPLI